MYKLCTSQAFFARPETSHQPSRVSVVIILQQDNVNRLQPSKAGLILNGVILGIIRGRRASLQNWDARRAVVLLNLLIVLLIKKCLLFFQRLA
jgi:hypothetical protein